MYAAMKIHERALWCKCIYISALQTAHYLSAVDESTHQRALVCEGNADSKLLLWGQQQNGNANNKLLLQRRGHGMWQLNGKNAKQAPS